MYGNSIGECGTYIHTYIMCQQCRLIMLLHVCQYIHECTVCECVQYVCVCVCGRKKLWLISHMSHVVGLGGD